MARAVIAERIDDPLLEGVGVGDVAAPLRGELAAQH
jgi:hypothetical protein